MVNGPCQRGGRNMTVREGRVAELIGNARTRGTQLANYTAPREGNMLEKDRRPKRAGRGGRNQRKQRKRRRRTQLETRYTKRTGRNLRQTPPHHTPAEQGRAVGKPRRKLASTTFGKQPATSSPGKPTGEGKLTKKTSTRKPRRVANGKPRVQVTYPRATSRKSRNFLKGQGFRSPWREKTTTRRKKMVTCNTGRGKNRKKPGTVSRYGKLRLSVGMRGTNKGCPQRETKKECLLGQLPCPYRTLARGNRVNRVAKGGVKKGCQSAAKAKETRFSGGSRKGEQGSP